MKILILGNLDCKIDDYLKNARKLGFNQNDLVFCHPDKFNLKILYDSDFSDFIYGPCPHNLKGVNKGLILQTIAKNQSHYPKVLTSIKQGTYLKLSITDFKKFLLATNYYKINLKNIQNNKQINTKKTKQKINKKINKTLLLKQINVNLGTI